MSKSVGNYTLINKLGSGSYAQVYKAQHRGGEMYAMKVISREKIGSIKLQENLDSEISIMRDYRHENIVQLYDHFTSPRHIYLVLEYCAGGDLQKFIKKNERLTESVTRKFLLQLAKGLSFLHSKNIIHRDIKPQNLLLTEATENAIIKYADFGFAKHLVEASMAQTPCGTPLYMAPEIFEMQEYNVKADIWSLGCVLFEMLVGCPPFKGQNPRELFMNIRSRHIRIPPEVIISADLKELLPRLLEIDPRNRIDLASLLSEAERLMPTSVAVTEEERLSVDMKLDSLQPTGSPTISPRREGVIPEEQLLPRPSGIAIDLSNSGGSMRRVRSRDQISGTSFVSSSPPNIGAMSSQAPAPVSTSPASQRQSAFTSATATTMLTLASNSQASNSGNPSSQHGTSPSQGNMVPKHRRSNSGDKRYSTSDLSPVTKALSLPKGDMSERYPSSVSDRFKQKEYSNSQVVSSRGGSGMIFGLGGPIDNSKRVSNSGSSSTRPQQKLSDGEDESDDFVMVEQTPSHPWKATPPNDPAPSSLMQSIPENGCWHGNSSEAQNAVNSSGFSQEELIHFNANVKRCSDTVQMVTAITAVADQMVRDALHPKKRLTGERDSRDGKTNVADDDSVGSYSSGDRFNRQRGKSFDMAQIPELLAPPFSLYLHAMTFLHDTIQRTAKFKETTHTLSSRETGNQIDALIEGLSKRFEQILQRAENCKKFLNGNESLPVPEQLLYQSALKSGQEASVDELLGNLAKAAERYQIARLLIDCVLMTAAEPSDRKVLQQFVQMFTTQLAICEESKAMHLRF